MAKPGALFMENTEISADRSAGEITGLLVRHGAKQIALDYKDERLSGLRFVLGVGQNDFAFSLPARTESVFKALMKNKPYSSSYSRCTRADYEQRTREAAERVGWRQLMRWVQAQVALMDIGMVSASEVFFPYLNIDASGRTLFQRFEESGMRLIAAPE